MELKCPNCGAAIPAENINIQEMVALCSQCHHLFGFNRSAVARKAKRHAPPQPERVHMHVDDDALKLAYRFVLSSGPAVGIVMATFAALVALILLIGANANGEPTTVQFVFGILALLFSYIAVVGVTTTTTIRIDGDSLEVRSGPLPFPIRDDKTLRTADITRITFEEMHQADSPLPPSYNICAELLDGARISVVKSLPRPHAHYIAHALDDYLHGAKDMALTESEYEIVGDTLQPETLEKDVPAYRYHRST